jgi:hypothetical protein
VKGAASRKKTLLRSPRPEVTVSKRNTASKWLWGIEQPLHSHTERRWEGAEVIEGISEEHKKRGGGSAGQRLHKRH